MGVSKEQRERVAVTCKCGCGDVFMAFPVYRLRRDGGGLRVPEYRRGHHPSCRRNQTGQKPVWNKGLRKETSQSVARQGVTGPEHWNYDKNQHPDWFAAEFDFRAFAERFGHKPRSKGGNKAYAAFRAAVMARDQYTCQDCGMQADEGEDLDLLHVHHIVFIKHDRSRIFDPGNVVTLCPICHHRRHRASK